MAGMRRRCGLFPDYFGHLFEIFIGVCKRWQTRRAIFDLSNLQFILVRQRDGYIAVTEQFPRLTSAPSPQKSPSVRPNAYFTLPDPIQQTFVPSRRRIQGRGYFEARGGNCLLVI